MIACGALAGHVREIVARRGGNRRPRFRPLPAVLHNRPQQIIIEAERAVVSALASHRAVVLAYADCGTYGALDELCAPVQHIAGCPGCTATPCSPAHPGWRRCSKRSQAPTCSPTSCCAASTASVLAELGLDRYPELWPDYFGHYTAAGLAGAAAHRRRWRPRRTGWRGMFGLPLTRVEVGVSRLEAALASLVGRARGERP